MSAKKKGTPGQKSLLSFFNRGPPPSPTVVGETATLADLSPVTPKATPKRANRPRSPGRRLPSP